MKKKKNLFEFLEEKIKEGKGRIILRGVWLFIKLFWLVLIAYIFTKNLISAVFIVILGLFLLYFTFFYFLSVWEDLVFFWRLIALKFLIKFEKKFEEKEKNESWDIW